MKYGTICCFGLPALVMLRRTAPRRSRSCRSPLFIPPAHAGSLLRRDLEPSAGVMLGQFPDIFSRKLARSCGSGRHDHFPNTVHVANFCISSIRGPWSVPRSLQMWDERKISACTSPQPRARAAHRVHVRPSRRRCRHYALELRSAASFSLLKTDLRAI